MPGCDACQAQLLDRLYGLLDATEAAAVDAHAATCPACAAALADARKSQSLFAAAAKGSFPNVTFAAPAAVPVIPKRHQAADERATVGRTISQWAVAAGLLLAVCGLAVPTALDVADFFDGRPEVVRATRGVAESRARFKDAEQTEVAVKAAADDRLAAAKRDHDRLVTAWIAEEKTVAAAAANKPFAVEVRGPAAAVPGAPNEYAVSITDKAGKPKRASLTASVKAADGTELHRQKLPAAEAATLRLPADVWTRLPAGGEAYLQVSAVDDAGTTATLREPVRLLGQVFVTFLTTDKPLYQPGETVYFRSTTLDRTRLLPPEQEVRLWFVLAGPDGKELATLSGQARATVASGGQGADVFGPDGRPVRGVGCGGFDLKPDVPGGTYTLSVFELPPKDAVRPPDGAKPLAKRVIQVAGYRPDRLEKKLEFDGSSYGPGEPVQAKLTVTDQGKPVAGAKLTAVAKADDKTLPVIGDTATAADGSAAVRFSLPAGESNVVTLSVTVETAGITETIVRPVPLASRKLTVEFFPEGGDLIAGLSNRVYFRATTGSGRPADVVGVLTDGERDIVPVRTLRDADRPGVNRGLGLFSFTPEAGKTYTVRLSQPANAEPGAFKLPAAKASGVVLLARHAATEPGKPIRVTLGYAGKKPQPVLVGAYTRGRAIAHTPATLTPGRTTDVTLDPGQTPLGGVVRVTVFADDGGDGRTELTPLAERLMFRRPKEALNLTATVGKPSFVPGEPVSLKIEARTETGSPTPAILWAAVVSRSVLSMADDKAERTLPTHFQLGGEVQSPDELEHADFLLTDQPHAAESLDLVLGTQGWRRFAEQNPQEFRARVPAAQADRLLAAVGVSPPQFRRTEDQQLADRYWPKYEAAALALERAEQGRADNALKDAADAFMQASRQYEGARAGLGTALDRFDPVDDRLTARRWWLVVTGPTFLLATAAMLWRRRRADTTERRWLTAGLAGMLLVALIVLAGSAVTADLGADWRREADTIERTTRDRWGRPVPKTATIVPPATVPTRPELDPDRNITLAKPQQNPGVEPPPGPAATHGPKLPDAPPKQPPVIDDGKPAVPKPAVARQPVSPPARPQGDRPADARLQRVLKQFDDPADRKAVESVRLGVPQGRPFVVREYAHQSVRQPGAPRTDFAETLLWKPVVVLPDTGTTTLDFTLSDAVTGYRVLVAGHTLDGRLGAVTETITVRPPLSVEPKLPREISTADTLAVPLTLTNGTAQERDVDTTVAIGGKALGGGNLSLVPNAGGQTLIRLPTLPAGTTQVSATATATVRIPSVGGWTPLLKARPDLTDTVRRTVSVVPDGFPVEGAKSERLAGKLTATVTLPGDRVAGGTRVGVTVYPNALAGVLGGLDGLLKEPHGCFEQSSSANYPNVLALDYLRNTKAVAPDAAGRSRALLDSGYRNLTRYECADTPAKGRKGFEWFGAADRPHPALSAYGLLQFADMARVYPVDPALVARTKAYLLSLRTGDGGFTHSTAALDRFGRAPDHVTDAYVVWAVSEAERTGDKSDLAKELDALLARAAGESAGDPYFLALVGNAALNRGKTDDGLKLLDAVAAKQAADGAVPGASATITASRGDDLVTETTALAVLGWLKADRPDRFAAPVGKAVGYLIGKRQSGGAFGATQATVLALKALVEHARQNTAEPESGELRLLVAGRLVAKQSVRTDAAGPVTLLVPDADELFPPGSAVELTAETTLKQPVPASLTWAVRTVQPPSGEKPPVTLAAGLDLSVLAEGQTSRLTATVTNSTDAATGMAVAILGLPAGLTVPADGKQLRRLTEDGRVDFWEVRGRELVLYWRGLAPKEAKIVAVELVAEYPGEFRAPASRAYLYYDAGRKHWLPPLKAVVKPAG